MLILDEPTRGIDVGAKAEIYRIISRFAGGGGATLLFSSEVQELLAICDRIYVLYRGRVARCLDRCEATEEKVGQLSLGVETTH